MNFRLFLFFLPLPVCSVGQNSIQVQIDHGGLHCPYLGPRFEQRFAERDEIDSVHVNSHTSIGTLYMADDKNLTDDEISDIIVHKVGYPRPEIKAIVRDEE